MRNGQSTTGTSTANATQTLTVAAKGQQRNLALGYLVVIRGGAAGADISIQLRDGAAVLWQDYIANTAAAGTRCEVMFPRPLPGTANTAMTLVIGAGGASVITEASLLHAAE